MTNIEMGRRFDIFYNNISSNQAPGLNSYEKSVLLTKAQDDLVKSRYSPFNDTKKGFESSENRRVELRELITPYSVSDIYIKEDIEIDDNSLFVKIPSDVYYILQEEVTLSATTTSQVKTTTTGPAPVDCITGKKVKVIPTTHDEYNTSKNNPFRKPGKNRVWRMDIQSSTAQDSKSKVDLKILSPLVELISKYEIIEYKMRYLRKPRPIVLETFDDNSEYTGLNLSVDGISTYTTCELSDEIQGNILDRAVELAILGYKENTLQANVGLNKRNI